MTSMTDEDLRKLLSENKHLSIQSQSETGDTAGAGSVTARGLSADFAEGVDQRVATEYRTPTDRQRPIKFRSKTEARAWEQWEVWCPEICDKVVRIEYEMFSFTNMPGGVRYKADFFILDGDGRLHIIDVKGSAGWKKHYGSGRSASNAIRTAADMYWWMASFYYLYPKQGEWVIFKVQPGEKRVSFRLSHVITP